MSITHRTVKMVLATLLAIYTADFLQLDHTLAAGIIAILSLLDTKRASFITAFKRVASTVTAFLIASVVFYLAGFSVTAFGLYLIIYIPLAYRFDLQSGIAPCSVLVTHFIGAGSISWSWQLNGFLLMTIGATSALLLNLWMPSHKSELAESKRQVDEGIRLILKGISDRLSGKDLTVKLTDQFREAEDLISEAKAQALKDYDNQLFHKNDYSLKYVQMRGQQLASIRKMLHSLLNSGLGSEEARILAELFNSTSEQLNEKNTGQSLLENIAELYRTFRQSGLPKSRAEFENRAYLFMLLNNIEEFIEIKRSFFVREGSVEEENEK
ncbi:MAG: aromatic acid exporter family protein [Alkalibacterium thalassium]|nr:aromatic acid exporter family protein [Alkalibacterium thalassium]